jgi:hypothetical protein
MIEAAIRPQVSLEILPPAARSFCRRRRSKAVALRVGTAVGAFAHPTTPARWLI